MDFVDKNIGHVELVKPPPIESTPFKLVQEVMDLKELAAKLRGVTEFAVNFVTVICFSLAGRLDPIYIFFSFCFFWGEGDWVSSLRK